MSILMGALPPWIADPRQRDDKAAARLRERYFNKWVQVPRRKLGRGGWGSADEEDAGHSAFDSLCRGVAEGDFSQVKNRRDLRLSLVTINVQKPVEPKPRDTRRERVRIG